MTVSEPRKVLFTFDYELFLGRRSGSVDKCVIEPTRKLISIFDQYHISAIFFVDTAWLLRLKEASADNDNARNDYKKVVEQLQQLAKSGHYIFNHLHPHWLDAKYMPDINQWDLSDQTHYRFNSLDNAKKQDLFAQTTQVLKEIIEPVNTKWVADGYRAGGWSIQPFEDFKPHFVRHNIKYDFSVMPGMKSITSAQQYDFTKVQANLPYYFSDDPTLASGKEFVEFPISSLAMSPSINFINRILLKFLQLSGDTYSGDGFSTASKNMEEPVAKAEMVSVELLTTAKLPSYLNFLKRNDYMQFISHPKMLSAHNTNTFTTFIKQAFSNYTIESDFRKMVI